MNKMNNILICLSCLIAVCNAGYVAPGLVAGPVPIVAPAPYARPAAVLGGYAAQLQPAATVNILTPAVRGYGAPIVAPAYGAPLVAPAYGAPIAAPVYGGAVLPPAVLPAPVAGVPYRAAPVVARIPQASAATAAAATSSVQGGRPILPAAPLPLPLPAPYAPIAPAYGAPVY